MPSFKTLKEAEQYGDKNYFLPRIKRTQQGNWNVKDEWGVENETDKLR